MKELACLILAAGGAIMLFSADGLQGWRVPIGTLALVVGLVGTVYARLLRKIGVLRQHLREIDSR